MNDSGEWRTPDRVYTIDSSTFTKRGLREDERIKNTHGETVILQWTRQRLQNEHLALMFIAENTTIPVPRVLSFEEVDQVPQLTLERIQGLRLDQITNQKDIAVARVNSFISKTVLPQLSSLKSNQLGSLTGDIIPPARLWERAKASTWISRVTTTPVFSFCHNDLAQHNILVDENNFKVLAILDWELSGFYTSDFEAALWTMAWDEPGYHQIGENRIEDLANFLSDPRASTVQRSDGTGNRKDA